MTVNQLETNARFVGFLLVRSADARTDKKGGSYLDLTLADKTATSTANTGTGIS